MKRPLSPTPSPESDVTEVSLESNDITDSRPGPSEHRMKREKKQQSFTLCEVCNIQLNSPAQAQIHYNGKSHQRRLKQLNNGKAPSNPGPGSGAPSPLFASLPLPGRTLQPQLDVKHFLPFRINGTSPLSLFPNFNAMDPVQKAVINHTFGVLPPLKKKQFISCNICHLRFNSANQAEAHYKGHKHARRLKALEAAKNKQKFTMIAKDNTTTESEPDREVNASSEPENTVLQNIHEGPKNTDGGRSSIMLTPSLEKPSVELAGCPHALVSPPVSELSEGVLDSSTTSSTVPGVEAAESESGSSSSTTSLASDSEKEGKKSKLHCNVCKVTVNSASQLEAHNSGVKHKLMLEGQTNQPRRGRNKLLSRKGYKTKRIGHKGSISIQNKAFHCDICEIYVNSETQLKQHMNSRRHKDRFAGKPPKPKYSPYNKLQQKAVLAVSYVLSKLALQKHLTKSLAAGFLPSPLTSMCTMPSALTLRPATSATLFQTPILGPALFRAAPGPLRATPTPILFAPY
ncbi:zinc finger protein 385C [Latimeria chalumnae]|uniref:zinc finger protein 385C n=1 Tax=Latimeria chalumnae TaxID=7897 RepID=UPI00313ED34D